MILVGTRGDLSRPSSREPRRPVGDACVAVAAVAAAVAVAAYAAPVPAGVPLVLAATAALLTSLMLLSVPREELAGPRWPVLTGLAVADTAVGVPALAAVAPPWVAVVVVVAPAVVVTWALTRRHVDARARSWAYREQVRAGSRAREAERRRWARELHDETLQDLAVLRMLLDSAERGSDLAAVRGALVGARGLVENQFSNLTALIVDSRPSGVVDGDLVAALHALAERVAGVHGLPVRIDAPGVPVLPAEVAEAVHQVVREAVANAVKHAAAGQVTVRLRLHDGVLAVEVADDGRGFLPTAATGASRVGSGTGLAGMRERAALASGTVRVTSAPGRGTTVRLRVPVGPPPPRARADDEFVAAVRRFMVRARRFAALGVPIPFTLTYVLLHPVGGGAVAGVAAGLAILALDLLLAVAVPAGTPRRSVRWLLPVLADAAVTLAIVTYLQLDPASPAWIGLAVVAAEAALTLDRRCAVGVAAAMTAAYGGVLWWAAQAYDRALAWDLFVLVAALVTAAFLVAGAVRGRLGGAEPPRPA